MSEREIWEWLDRFSDEVRILLSGGIPKGLPEDFFDGKCSHEAARMRWEMIGTRVAGALALMDGVSMSTAIGRIAAEMLIAEAETQLEQSVREEILRRSARFN
jgi:hypothetical protein